MSRPKTVYTFVTSSHIVRVSDGRYDFGEAEEVNNNAPFHKGRVVAIHSPNGLDDPELPFVSGFDTEFSESGLERIESFEQAINYVAGVIP